MRSWWLCVALCLAGARALPSSLAWTTIDGGGVQDSAGGDFRLSATAGQPDAGTSAGGGFTLQSGFWGGIADEPGWTEPSLRIGPGPGRPHVYWPAAATNWTLQSAADLRAGLWQDGATNAVLLGAERAVPVDIAAPSLNYRLFKQP